MGSCILIEFISANYHLLTTGIGLVMFLLALYLLISYRRKAAVKIEFKTRFFHSILDASPQSILVIDQTGKIIEVNRSIEQLTSYNRAELLHGSISKIAPAFDIEKLKQSPPSPLSNDIELVMKSGERLPYLLFLTPFAFEDRSYFTVLIRNPKDLNAIEVSSRRALDVIQSRMDELSTIRRVTESLNQATTLRGALSSVMETIRSITKSPYVWLFLPDEASASCQRIDYDPMNNSSPMAISYCNGSAPVCVATLLSGELGTAQVVEGCDCILKDLNGSTTSSHYALPLYLGKKPIGVLNFIESTQHPITENKLDLLHTICDSLSIALERVRLFNTEHEQRKLAETLRDIGTNLTKSLDLAEVLDLLLDQLKRLIPYDGGHILGISEDTAFIERIRGYEAVSKDEIEEFKSTSFPLATTHNLKQIAIDKKSKSIPDVSKDPDWVSGIVSKHYHSWLGAPVVVDGKAEVIFSLHKEETDFYSPRHAELLTAFCGQAALAIKNARLYSRELRRIQELDGLQATLTGINSELDLNMLLKEIITRAITLLNGSMGELGLYEPENDGIRIAVSESLDKDYRGLLVKLGQGTMGQVAQTLKPLIISDYSHWENALTDYKNLPANSVLAIPMVAGNELYGVIGIGDNNVNRRFSKDDIRLLESFAQQAIIAIQNARLFADAKKRAEEAEILSRAGALVTATLDQKEAIERILEQLAFVVPYDSASVLLKQGEKLVVVGGHGFSDPSPVLGLSYELDSKNPGAVVFLENKPLVVNNLMEAFSTFPQIPQSEHEIRSWLGAPLTIKGKPIGILSLDAHELNNFNEEHSRLVTSFADQVSIALENARLYTEEVQSAARFKTLYEFGQTIITKIKLEEMYPEIFAAVKKLMRTEYFSIALVDREKQMINDVFIMDREQSVELESRGIGKGLFGKVISEGKPLLFHSFTMEQVETTGAIVVGEIDEGDEEEISQSILIVPLRSSAGVIGVLSAQSYTRDMYDETDMEALELLASNVAVAIENARLFTKIQSMAITDDLTTLFNRRKFYELAVQEFERSRRYGRPLSVIMLDIDHFKRVNDTYGHSVGDQVLQGLAALAKTSLRQVDILARYGGEEFVVLLPETDIEEAVQTAERLRTEAADATIPTRVGNMSITISLGVVTLDDTCRTLEELLDRSDQAMYASKRTGRNKVSNWKPEYSVKLPGTGPLPVIKPNLYL
jgi:diguanylate cyclase (GGDEF)-like protein/PAS domain S-box-containing protein